MQVQPIKRCVAVYELRTETSAASGPLTRSDGIQIQDMRRLKLDGSETGTFLSGLSACSPRLHSLFSKLPLIHYFCVIVTTTTTTVSYRYGFEEEEEEEENKPLEISTCPESPSIVRSSRHIASWDQPKHIPEIRASRGPFKAAPFLSFRIVY